jgi:creatinine amidohydrolase/Fe(II)-dependent formamide hydrolase-like protein
MFFIHRDSGQFIRDILESLYRRGIRHVFIMNGHDGNILPIEIAARGIGPGLPPQLDVR